MKRLVLVLIVLVILSYGLFEARRLIEGPVITISSPKDGSATSSLITIAGTADNISFLTIDDKPAFTDIAGHFSVTLSPPDGYSIITVAALDRFGRRAHKEVKISVLNYCPIS